MPEDGELVSLKDHCSCKMVTDLWVDVEKFEPVTTRRSAAWHERRHGVAQRFLDHFMRKV